MIPDQGGQLVFPVQIDPVRGGVLRDEDELLDAHGIEGGGLFDDLAHGAAAHLSADHGDGAVGAAVGAALGDLEVGHGVAGGDDALAAEEGGFLVVEAGELRGFFLGFPGLVPRLDDGADRLADAVDAAHAEDGVDLGELAEDLLAVAFGEASGDDDPAQGVVIFEPAEVEDVVDGFLFRAFDERAGVHDHDIRLGLVRGDLITLVHEMPEHDLRVAQVL